jgi:hypothetical protein
MKAGAAVAITSNSVGADVPCAICGTWFDLAVGPVLHVQGAAGGDVCDRCGRAHAHELAFMLRWYHATADMFEGYQHDQRREREELSRAVGDHDGRCQRFIAKRQTDTILVRRARTVRTRKGVVHISEERRPVSNAEINWELTALKRAFVLALRAGKILHRPHIPLLKENNVRTGFFEESEIRAVLANLPDALRPVIIRVHHGLAD